MVSVIKAFSIRHSPVIAIAAISLSIALIGDSANLALRYDREEIIAFEWWRLFTGNLAHLSWNHLWMNLAGLIMIWIIYDQQLSTTQWLINFFVCSIAVGLNLYLFNPELSWYVGLSGTLHGLLMAGIIINVSKKQRLDLILFVLVSGKLAWEQFAGALPGSAETAGGPVIVDAHLYGAIAGLIMGLIYAYTHKTHKHSPTTNN